MTPAADSYGAIAKPSQLLWERERERETKGKKRNPIFEKKTTESINLIGNQWTHREILERDKI